MHKIVSILLSGVLVASSVMPSYGEGLSGLRRERARAGVYVESDNTRMGKGIEMAVLRGRQVQAGAQGKGLLKEVEGLYGYKGFSAQYRKAVGEAYEEAMGKQMPVEAGRSALEEGESLARRNVLTEKYQELMKEEHIRAEYKRIERGEARIFGEPEQIKGLGKRRKK